MKGTWEKMYNEALERAKELLDSPRTCFDIVQLKEIFPELAESEDERIRKEIVEYFKHYSGGDNVSIKFPKWIAYLEKQKEQKPILSDRDSTDFEIEVHEIIAQARNDSRLNDADVLKQFEEEAAFALMLKANKLIEQKPAEWSDEDEVCYVSVIAHLKESITNGKPETYKSGRLTNWIDNRVRLLRPHQKTEWSEEDRDRVAQYLHDRDGGMLWSKATEITSDILDLLRPQPHWKPSEEDIKMLEHIIGQYETGNKNSKVMGYLPRVEELSFLKNVLSKWKNSK